VRNAAFSLLETTIDHLHYRGAENFEREILEEALFEFGNINTYYAICILFSLNKLFVNTA